MIDRRGFLGSSLQLGGWALASQLFGTLIPHRAWAQPSANQKFLFLRVSLGWDTSLAMDPWVGSSLPQASDYYIEYAPSDLLVFNSGFVGPALTPMQKYFSKMSIINGILVSVNDGGHSSATTYMTTGNGQGHLGTVNVEVDAVKHDSNFGVFANDSLQLGSQNSMITNYSGYLTGARMSTNPYWQTGDTQNTDLDQDKLALMTYQNQMKLFNQSLDSAQTKLGAGQNLGDGDVIAAAFSSGVSSSAYFSYQKGNLDTHSDHPVNHKRELTKAFTQLAGILDCLAATPDPANSGTSVLDNTTVYICSEFTRTPALNQSAGKDHNPQTNSVIIMSPQFKPGIYGASYLVDRASSPSRVPYLAALPLDSISLQPVQRIQGAFVLRPENVVASLLASMGIDPKQVSRGLGEAQILKMMLK